MSMTMEQVVTQLQQDLFKLRAQVAAELQTQCELSTISRQPNSGRVLRVSSPKVFQEVKIYSCVAGFVTKIRHNVTHSQIITSFWN